MRKVRIGFVVGTALLTVSIAVAVAWWLYVHRESPVVWTIDAAPASVDIGTQALNPFRDRDPEICAAHFRDRLRDGQIEGALSSVAHGDSPAEPQLDYERRHQIASFALQGRRDRGGETLLYFRATEIGGAEEGCYITVARDAGSWRVTRYERSD